MGEQAIEIGLPEKMELIDHGSYIEIRRSWFGLKAVIMALFAFVWDSFLVFWYP